MRGSHDDLVLRAQELARRGGHDGTLAPPAAIGPIPEREVIEEQLRQEQIQREVDERDEYRRAHPKWYALKRFATGKLFATLCYVVGYPLALVAVGAGLLHLPGVGTQSVGFFGTLMILGFIGWGIGASLSGHWTLAMLTALFRRRLLASATIAFIVVVGGADIGVRIHSRPASFHVSNGALQSYNQAMHNFDKLSLSLPKASLQEQFIQELRHLEAANLEVERMLPLQDNPTLTTKLSALVQATNDWTSAMDSCGVSGFYIGNASCIRAGDPTLKPFMAAYADAIKTYNDQR